MWCPLSLNEENKNRNKTLKCIMSHLENTQNNTQNDIEDTKIISKFMIIILLVIYIPILFLFILAIFYFFCETPIVVISFLSFF